MVVQASLAAALRDGGIIAELGYAKADRITNERNKSYPDKAIAAVLAAVSTGASESAPTQQASSGPQKASSEPQHPEMAPAPAPPPVKLPKTATEQEHLRVGCIVDIPNSPHVPPMRIGKRLLLIWNSRCSLSR